MAGVAPTSTRGVYFQVQINFIYVTKIYFSKSLFLKYSVIWCRYDIDTIHLSLESFSEYTPGFHTHIKHSFSTLYYLDYIIFLAAFNHCSVTFLLLKSWQCSTDCCCVAEVSVAIHMISLKFSMVMVLPGPGERQLKIDILIDSIVNE